jgi:hypothetical protein
MLQIEIINPDTLTRFNKEHRTHYLFPNKNEGSTNIRFENVEGSELIVCSVFYLKELYVNDKFEELEKLGKRRIIIDSIHEHIDVVDLTNLCSHFEKKPIVLGANILLYDTEICYSLSKEFAIYQFVDVLIQLDFVRNKSYDFVSFNNAKRPYRDALVSKLKEIIGEYNIFTYLASDETFFSKTNDKYKWKDSNNYIDVVMGISKAHFNIYSESMFSRPEKSNECVKVTEKSYWPLMCGTPFLSFEYNNDKIKFLKKFGFETFDDINLFPEGNFTYEETLEILSDKINKLKQIDIVKYYIDNVGKCEKNHMIIKDILETYDIEKDFNNLINKIYETETNG